MLLTHNAVPMDSRLSATCKVLLCFIPADDVAKRHRYAQGNVADYVTLHGKGIIHFLSLAATGHDEVFMNIDLSTLLTERRNANSANIDTLSTLDMLTLINKEDQQVAHAITPYLAQIAQVVDKVAAALQAGGRLIYTGAGTSGRLGILDASECPPTFGSRPEQVVGLIAGGHKAILSAVENAEDSKEQGALDLQAIKFSQCDVLVGLAASGRTPYVLGAMEYAQRQQAFVAMVSCNPQSEMVHHADVAITPVVGPEVVTGSTRLKAGTAQKLVLNMITTGAMIRLGKVYGNLMVDVEATNAKLIERQVSIVMEATECDRHTAQTALEACRRHCKTAIVMVLTGLDAMGAHALLANNNGYIRHALSASSQERNHGKNS